MFDLSEYYPSPRRNIGVIIDEELFDDWLRTNRNYAEFNDLEKDALKEMLIENMKREINKGLNLFDYCTGCGYPLNRISGPHCAYPFRGQCYHLIPV